MTVKGRVQKLRNHEGRCQCEKTVSQSRLPHLLEYDLAGLMIPISVESIHDEGQTPPPLLRIEAVIVALHVENALVVRHVVRIDIVGTRVGNGVESVRQERRMGRRGRFRRRRDCHGNDAARQKDEQIGQPIQCEVDESDEAP